MSSPNSAPPQYSPIPIIYDETFRGVWYESYSVATAGNMANLIGRLEHHDPSSDGSFGICVASGVGVVLKQALWESIPADKRPSLNKNDAGIKVEFPFTRSQQQAIGSVFLPIVLKNEETGQVFKIKVLALVVPELVMGMFISMSAPFYRNQVWGDGIIMHTFEFDGGKVKVRGPSIR